MEAIANAAELPVISFQQSSNQHIVSHPTHPHSVLVARAIRNFPIECQV